MSLQRIQFDVARQQQARQDFQQAQADLIAAQKRRFAQELTSAISAANLPRELRNSVREGVIEIATAAIEREPSLLPHARNLVALVTQRVKQAQANATDVETNAAMHVAPGEERPW